MSIPSVPLQPLRSTVGQVKPFDLEDYYSPIELKENNNQASLLTTTEVTAFQAKPISPVLAQQGSSPLGTALMVFVPIVGVGFIFWLLNTTIRICDPNKILVISGRLQTVNGR